MLAYQAFGNLPAFTFSICLLMFHLFPKKELEIYFQLRDPKLHPMEQLQMVVIVTWENPLANRIPR